MSEILKRERLGVCSWLDNVREEREVKKSPWWRPFACRSYFFQWIIGRCHFDWVVSPSLCSAADGLIEIMKCRAKFCHPPLCRLFFLLIVLCTPVDRTPFLQKRIYLIFLPFGIYKFCRYCMFDPTGSRVSSWWNSLRDGRIRFAPGKRVSIFRTVFTLIS